MKLENGYTLPDFSGDFSGYSGHRNKSSNLKLIPTGGILQKDKKRSKKRSIHELVSLSAWNKLLDFHSTDDISIQAPIPYGTDKGGKIFMEFLEGVSTDKLLSNDYDKSGKLFSKDDVRSDFSKRLGRILRIKDIEHLAHGDFQLRHLIHNVNSRRLGVIDVENSAVNPSNVQGEHKFIRGQIDAIFGQSQKYKKYMSDGIEEGYYADIEDRPMLGDIANDLQVELGFHKEQVSKLFTYKAKSI